MPARPLPTSFRRQIGDEAARDLTDWTNAEREDWSADVLDAAADRFGRTVAEELGKLRVEFARALGDVRVEFHRTLGDEISKVRGEIATTRVELLKWSFLFWVGQAAAVAGLLTWMLRTLPVR